MADTLVTLQSRALSVLGWEPDDFADLLYLESLPFFQRFLARCLWPFRRHLFGQDLQRMAQLASLDSLSELSREIAWFGSPRNRRGILREFVGIRPRGRRIMDWAKELFEEDLPAEPVDSESSESSESPDAS